MIKLSKKTFPSNISRQLASWHDQKKNHSMRPGASLPAALSWRTSVGSGRCSEVGREPGGRGLFSRAGPQSRSRVGLSPAGQRERKIARGLDASSLCCDPEDFLRLSPATWNSSSASSWLFHVPLSHPSLHSALQQHQTVGSFHTVPF